MIEKLLSGDNISYKVIDEDNGFKIIKVNSKLHILYLYGKGTQFLMERDLFEYLDGNSIPYSILCHDTSSNSIFYLKLKSFPDNLLRIRCRAYVWYLPENLLSIHMVIIIAFPFLHDKVKSGSTIPLMKKVHQ